MPFFVELLAQWSVLVSGKYQAGVGAAKTKAVGHNSLKVGVVATLGDDVHVGCLFVEFLNVSGGTNKIVFHHQQAVDGDRLRSELREMTALMEKKEGLGDLEKQLDKSKHTDGSGPELFKLLGKF